MLTATEALDITNNFENAQKLQLKVADLIRKAAQLGLRSTTHMYTERATYSTEVIFKKLKEKGYSVEAEFQYDPEPAYSHSFKGIRIRTVTLNIRW